MHQRRLLSLVRSILSQPTAPYHEYHARAEIIKKLSLIPEVTWKIDHFGNVIARYRKGRGGMKWALGVHMDHPGWVGGRPDQPGSEAVFLGGVPDRYLCKPSNRKRTTDFGGFAMWDVPAFELVDDHIHGRACDDLIGCALTLALLQELSSKSWEGSCGAIFTRAEEVGFVGAFHVGNAWPFEKNTTFLSLETSAPAGSVRMGSGPVCRVGDRISVFDSDATAEIVAAATAGKIPAQRALLDRGACEATALQLFGVRSAGISVPLGNYHNCGPRNQIAAEFVALDDVKNTLRLLVATVTGLGTQIGSSSLKSRLQKRHRETQKYAKSAQVEWATFPPTPPAK